MCTTHRDHILGVRVPCVRCRRHVIFKYALRCRLTLSARCFFNHVDLNSPFFFFSPLSRLTLAPPPTHGHANIRALYTPYIRYVHIIYYTTAPPVPPRESYIARRMPNTASRGIANLHTTRHAPGSAQRSVRISLICTYIMYTT